MVTQALIVNAVVLFAVLEADLGKARKITRLRLVRPVLTAAAIVPLFLKGVASAGDGLTLEIAATAVGILLGLLASAAMTVYREPGTGRSVTKAGATYAGLWVLVIAARSAFSYGAVHWFNHSLGTWMVAHSVDTNAITASLIFMALAMTLTRTFGLVARRDPHAVALAV